MDEIICSKCNSVMIQIGSKYVCSNDNCDNQELFSGQKWYEQLANDPKLWNENVINTAPSIVAYEYEMLRKLLREGSTYGVPLKIKDLFEVILKFPVLLILAEALERRKNNGLYNDVLLLLTGKLPAMGDWLNAAGKIEKTEPKRADAIMSLLRNINSTYSEEHIVTWRNDNIGHGALKLDDNMCFQNDIKRMVKIISDHFKDNETWYKDIKFMLKYQGNYHNLNGSKMARDLPFAGGSLYAKIENHNVVLDPLIQYVNKGVYFFDSYSSKKNITAFINYPSGDKLKQEHKKIYEIYKSLRKKTNLLLAEASAQEKIYPRSQAETIEKIIKPEHLVRFEFLYCSVKEFLSKHSKGICLVQMENGMGKTTFTRMLDELSYNKMCIKNTMCRAFYINDVYSYSPNTFVTKLIDILRTTVLKEGVIVPNDNEGDIPAVDTNAPEADIAVAKLINTLFDYHHKIYGKEKIILIIDGIDELPQNNGRSLIDLIPDPKLLNPGVYIVVTCRTDKQISNNTNKLIQSLILSEKVVVEKTSLDYNKLLHKYILERTNASNAEVSKIIELADGKFINVEILIKAFDQQGFEAVEALPTVAGESLLKVLANLYGERYYDEILKMLIVLVLSPIPVTVKEISVLCGEDVISFKHLCYLSELRPFIDVHRSATGNRIRLQHQEVASIVRQQEGLEVDKLRNEWFNTLSLLMETTQGKEFDEDEFCYVMITFIALLDQPRKLVTKLGRNLPRILESFADYLHTNSYNMAEHLYQSYYVLYKDINSVIKECLVEKIDFDAEKYCLLLRSISELLYYNGELQLAIEHLLEGISILNENKVSMNMAFLGMAYGQLARLYSRAGNKQDAEKYFSLANETTQELYKYLPSNTNDRIISFFAKAGGCLSEAVHCKNRSLYNKACSILDSLMDEIRELEKTFVSENEGLLSVKVQIFMTYANVYKRHNPNKALEYMLMAQSELYHLSNTDHEKEDLECYIQINMGQVYRQLKKHDEATSCYDKALQIVENRKLTGRIFNIEHVYTIYNSKGNVERDLGNWAKSIEYYSQAVKVCEKSKNEGKQIDETFYANCLKNRSEAYVSLGLLDKAEEDMKKVDEVNYDEELAMHSSNADNVNNTDTLYNKALQYLQRGRFDHAISILNEAIQLNSNRAQYYLDRSYCYGEMGKHREAVEDQIKGLAMLGVTNDVVLSTKQKPKQLFANLISCSDAHAYSLPIYLARTGEQSRALLHLEYGWYLSSVGIGLDFIAIPQGNGKFMEINNNVRTQMALKYLTENTSLPPQDKTGSDKSDNTEQGLLTLADKYIKGEVPGNIKNRLYFGGWMSKYSVEDANRFAGMFTDRMIAFEILVRAARQGSKEAWARLAEIYSQGDFPVINKTVAKRCLELSKG